jgi:hypothetical protein
LALIGPGLDMGILVFQSFRGARETREPGIPKFSS